MSCPLKSDAFKVSLTTVLRFCSCSGGAVGSIILVFTQLHNPGFNLEFETLFELVWQMIADLRLLQNSFSIVLRQC